MSRVLIVEDEMHLAEGLRFNLEAEGYGVEVVDTGEAALERLKPPHSFDVLVLDVMLPGKDGFSVMAELRAAGQFIATLILTARSHPADVLKGFAAGADDYLTKPFDLGILIARIRSLLRRRDWMKLEATDTQDAPVAEAKGVYEFRGRKVDFDLLQLHTPGEVVQLTLMEANLLRYLIQNEGKVVSRKSILEDVWGVHEDTDTRPIDNFIVRLRRYVEDDPTRPCHLVTVRGVGYRFVAYPGQR